MKRFVDVSVLPMKVLKEVVFSIKFVLRLVRLYLSRFAANNINEGACITDNAYLLMSYCLVRL